MFIAGNGEVELSANHQHPMGIDIYARWPGQDKKALDAQAAAWGFTDSGDVGYIREAYHGEPYPSQHLMPEAFDNDDGVVLPVAILRKRLPETPRLAAMRERAVYGVEDEAEISAETVQYQWFVEFCESVEKETGQPPTIVASW